MSKLVTILNQTRGAQATLPSLLSVGTQDLSCEFAFSGAKPDLAENPYASILAHSWEYPEPEDWTSELKKLLPLEHFQFFLDPKNELGLAQTPGDV
jgi:hypothetical protein